MCGIIGILGTKPVAGRLIDGLKRLEYRGYDSTGFAVLNGDNFLRLREPGKIVNLEKVFDQNKFPGDLGIAHTRWATHGAPTQDNAHPHLTDKVALVHNGIIENHNTLRAELVAQGVTFTSQTDSEVIVHLLTQEIARTPDPIRATQNVIDRLEGAYALGIMFHNHPDLLIGVRKGCPLAAGSQGDEKFLGSDAHTLSTYCDRITFLEDGDMVVLTPGSMEIFDIHHLPALRPSQPCHVQAHVSKDPYPHFMLKEIYEQPLVMRNILSQYLNAEHSDLSMNLGTLSAKDLQSVTIIACGTSYYAGLVAQYWFEKFAKIACHVEIASEFRYRTPPMADNGLTIFISQSGETADTIAAHAYAKSIGQFCLGIINVPQSTLDRTVDASLLTYAGPEIGVASTKAFTAQLTVLACLVLEIAKRRGIIEQKEVAQYLKELCTLPALMEKELAQESSFKKLSKHLVKAQDVLYLGRGTSFALALEGALKLKEITYIHAEGYASGEMKHGPIALIDESVPIVVIAPHDELLEKTLSNVQEAAARRGQVILLTDEQGAKAYHGPCLDKAILTSTSAFTSPAIYAIAVQLLAYHTAVLKGTDVDQPRNLAKSVTVE